MKALEKVRNSKFNRKLLIFLLFGGMFSFGMISGTRGIILTQIRLEYKVGYNMQGTLLLLNSLGAICFLYVATNLLRGFGVKVSNLVNFILAALSMAIMMFIDSFAFIIFLSVMIYAANQHFNLNKNAIFSMVFTAKYALWMLVLHSSYGFGSAVGPYILSYLMSGLGLSWRYVYLAFSSPMYIFLLITIITGFDFKERSDIGSDTTVAKGPGSNATVAEGPASNATSAEDTDNKTKAAKVPVSNATVAKGPGISVKDSFKTPVVWYYALCVAMASSVEFGVSNWAATYMMDAFGVDPVTTGAMILSVYFVFFTVTRLCCGFIMERYGYMKILIFTGLIQTALLVTYLSLGIYGLWLLPAIGATVAPFYPVQQAAMVKVFHRDATVMMSASAMISGVITALTQYGMGMANTLFGPSWGFWLMTVFCAGSVFLHIITGKKLNQIHGENV